MDESAEPKTGQEKDAGDGEDKEGALALLAKRLPPLFGIFLYFLSSLPQTRTL